MKEVIMKVPSFSADYPKAPIYVAELVRCGECMYWKNSLCQAWHRVIPKDGYCSIGERDGSTQTETQNSNLTFEKADERCKGCKHYKLTCDLFSEICEYEPKTESFDKDINARSKDEPQTCEECEHWNGTEDGCADRHGCKTEPQTGRSE